MFGQQNQQQQRQQQPRRRQRQQHAFMLWLGCQFFFKCIVLLTSAAVVLTATTRTVEGRPNFSNIVTSSTRTTVGGGGQQQQQQQRFRRNIFGSGGGGSRSRRGDVDKSRRTTTQIEDGSSLLDISLTSSSSSTTTTSKRSTTSKTNLRTFLSTLVMESSPSTLLSSSSGSRLQHNHRFDHDQNTGRQQTQQPMCLLASSKSQSTSISTSSIGQQTSRTTTETAATEASSSVGTRRNNNSSSRSSSIFDNIKDDVRGGASVAARRAAKTMSARKMETFKFLSGGVAGTVAACITNPLEVIKTQMQSSNKELSKAKGHPVEIAKTIMDADGFSGFFRGLPPTLIGIIPSRSAYFYAYQRIKSLLNPTLPEGSPPNALIAGFMAGIVGNTLTNPIWMVRTRMQLLIDHTAGQRAYTGYGDAIKTIFKEEGLGGFYKGITASYWGCAEGALQFIIYEQIKTKLIDRQNRARAAKGLQPTSELPKSTYFWAAAASKCVAAIATYPHEVARTRMREQARSGIFKYKGMWQTIGLMSKEEGLKSLYGGMGVHLVKVVPNSAFMFLTYEVVRSWLDGYEIVEQRTLEGSDD